MKELSKDYQDCLIYLRRMLGRDLKAPDILFMEGMREKYSLEFIDVFLGYAAQKKCTSIRDIKRVLKEVEERGIATWEILDDWRDRESYYEECKDRLGLPKSRKRTKTEEERMDFWEKAVGRDAVYEAIKKTVLNATRPSYAYCDKIISEWLIKGARSLEDCFSLGLL